MNSQPGPIEILLEKPLSETTRKERRALLLVSTVAIAVAKTGLVPKRVPALGIEFSPTESSALLILLSLVIAYFLVAFVVYALADIALWRASYHRLRTEAAIQSVEQAAEMMAPSVTSLTGFSDTSRQTREVGEAILGHSSFLRRAVRPLSIARIIFDSFFPIAIAFYAIYVLLSVPIEVPPPTQP